MTALQLQTEPQVGQTAAQQVLQVVVGSLRPSAVSEYSCMLCQLSLDLICEHCKYDKCNVTVSDKLSLNQLLKASVIQLAFVVSCTIFLLYNTDFHCLMCMRLSMIGFAKCITAFLAGTANYLLMVYIMYIHMHCIFLHAFVFCIVLDCVITSSLSVHLL